MKRFSPLFPLLLGFQVLSCLGQSSNPSGIFPGPFVPPVPNLTANLKGAKAIPPNKSPVTARATCGLASFSFPSYIYTFFIEVDFRLSQITNNPNIVPDRPSIQYHDGKIVEDTGCPPGECPFILSPPPLPWLTFCDGCPDEPFSPATFEGRFAVTPEQVAALATGQWYVNVTFATSNGIPLPHYTIRGQIMVDSDEDGVPDDQDECPGTPVGAVVDAYGCSIEQLCPCDGPWKNQGEYLERVEEVTADFHHEGLITKRQRQAILHDAEHLECGQTPPPAARLSGITGQSLIYVCPVEFPGEVCTQPFATSFQVFSESGDLITERNTDTEGRFRINLKPGDYQVVPRPPSQPQAPPGLIPPSILYPFAPPFMVTVPFKKFVKVVVVFDSGVR